MHAAWAGANSTPHGPSVLLVYVIGCVTCRCASPLWSRECCPSRQSGSPARAPEPVGGDGQLACGPSSIDRRAHCLQLQLLRVRRCATPDGALAIRFGCTIAQAWSDCCVC